MEAAISLTTRAREADTAIRADVRLLRTVQARMGRNLLVLDDLAKQIGFCAVGSTTFAIYCEGAGLSAAEGAQFRDAARACAGSPELAQKVANAEISVPKAAAAAPLVTNPDLRKPGESIPDFIAGKTTRQVQQQVHRRKEEARVQEPAIPKTFWLRRKTFEDFARARDLVTGRLKQPASDERTLEVLVDEYLDRHDLERRLARARARQKTAAEKKTAADEPSAADKQRVADEQPAADQQRATEEPSPAGSNATAANAAPAKEPASAERPAPGADPSSAVTPSAAGKPSLDQRSVATPSQKSEQRQSPPARLPVRRSRHIPAEEQRKILERQGGDVCAIEACDSRGFLSFAHGRRPFRRNGPNTAANVGRLCWPHHAQYDAGLWRVVKAADGWILVDRRGVRVGRLRDPPAR